MTRRIAVVVAMVAVLAACDLEPQVAPSPTAPGTQAPVASPSTTLPPLGGSTTTSPAPDETLPGPVEVPNVFSAQREDAIARLEELGFVVVAYEVCSGSVAAGEVRQVVYPDSTELVGSDGVSQEGRQVPFGSVVEVKVGSGAPCD